MAPEQELFLTESQKAERDKTLKEDLEKIINSDIEEIISKKYNQEFNINDFNHNFEAFEYYQMKLSNTGINSKNKEGVSVKPLLEEMQEEVSNLKEGEYDKLRAIRERYSNKIDAILNAQGILLNNMHVILKGKDVDPNKFFDKKRFVNIKDQMSNFRKILEKTYIKEIDGLKEKYKDLEKKYKDLEIKKESLEKEIFLMKKKNRYKNIAIAGASIVAALAMGISAYLLNNPKKEIIEIIKPEPKTKIVYKTPEFKLEESRIKKILTLNDVLFEMGDHQLKPKFKDKIYSRLDELKLDNKSIILIDGYTSPEPLGYWKKKIYSNNMVLSEARALSLAKMISEYAHKNNINLTILYKGNGSKNLIIYKNGNPNYELSRRDELTTINIENLIKINSPNGKTIDKVIEEIKDEVIKEYTSQGYNVYSGNNEVKGLDLKIYKEYLRYSKLMEKRNNKFKKHHKTPLRNNKRY
jgi:outer membrane protein OmpA-like peptidoglycan-associated protein